MVGKGATALSYLRLTPYKTDTESGRVAERMRLLGLAILSSGMTKGTSLLLMILSVKWGSDYLGVERFGMWMTIASLINVLSFADLGVSNSLINLVSEASGQKNIRKMRLVITNGYYSMLLISIILAIIFWIIYPFISWENFLNVREKLSIEESGPSIGIYVSLFLISMPLSIVSRVQIALQKSWIFNIWSFIGQIATLLGLYYVVKFKGGVPYLVLSLAGIPLIFLLFNYMKFFYVDRKDISPIIACFKIPMVKKIMHIGALFLIMQAMTIIGSASDSIIIAQMLGAKAVSSFAISQKLTTILGLSALFIAPMWPIFIEALASGDKLWAKKAFSRLLILSTMMGMLSGLVFYIYGNSIIEAWSGPDMIPSSSLSLGFSIFAVLMSIGGAVAVFVNNNMFLKTAVVFLSISSVISIAFKIFFIHYLQDASGAIWGSIFGYTIFYIIPVILLSYLKIR